MRSGQRPEEGARREKSRYVVQSVMQALSTLEAFTDEDDELGMTELCNRLKLNKKTVARLLNTLIHRGYIEQDRLTGNYRLGLKSFEIGQVLFQKMGLLKQARSVLEQLGERCDETIYVAVLRDGGVVYLEMMETSQSVRIVSRVGSRAPAYCTAVGKAQLAFLDDEEIKNIIFKEPLHAHTDQTITDPNELYAHLKEVRDRGYALDNGEYEPDVVCVGAPIRDYSKRVVAGICVSGPQSRMRGEKVTQLIDFIRDAAMAISHRLGCDIGLNLE